MHEKGWEGVGSRCVLVCDKKLRIGGNGFFFQSGSFFTKVSSSACQVSEAGRGPTPRATWGAGQRGEGTVTGEGAAAWSGEGTRDGGSGGL